MDVTLDIPDEIAQAIRLPEDQLGDELRRELAVALYQRGYPAFGKAGNWPGWATAHSGGCWTPAASRDTMGRKNSPMI
jgi:hypothetical protein